MGFPSMKIVILGAGVAGVSSAIALKKKGFDVRIFERHESASTIGAGIVVWPNAAYVLDQLGVLADIEAVSGHPTRMRRLSSTNEALGAIDIEKINSHMGYASLSILRSDFQRILVSKLESMGVAIQYAHTVASIETQIPDQAEVHFQNGPKVTADVLIGADGRMASCARQYVLGANAPVYQGFINWIGVYESDVESFDDIAVTDYWGVGERFGIVPVTKHKAYWAGGVSSADIGPRNQAEFRAELGAIFSGWPQPVQRMIDHTPVERVNKVYVHDHDPTPTWHKHNLVVIGDAAHAVQSAFVKFTEMRLEKTTGITMAGRGLAASFFHRDEKFCAARNESSKHTDFDKVAAAMSRGWSQHLPLNA